MLARLAIFCRLALFILLLGTNMLSSLCILAAL